MNKIILVLIILILISLSVLIILIPKNEKSGQADFSPTPKVYDVSTTITPQQTLETGMEISGYKVLWIIVRDTDKIKLFSNLDEKLTSKEARQKNACLYLVSSGFFDKNFRHIGLYVIDGETFSPYQTNNLFNGIYSIDFRGNANIGFSPEIATKIAVQAGPVILYKGKTQNINTENDKNARRVMVSLNSRGESVFLIIYSPSNTLLGPSLSEMPAIISELNDSTSLNLTDVLNLDGGAHSAFLSDILISEISNIGGYFCIKP